MADLGDVATWATDGRDDYAIALQENSVTLLATDFEYVPEKMPCDPAPSSGSGGVWMSVGSST